MRRATLALAAVLVAAAHAAEPNPPSWPSTVHVFSPGAADTNATIQSIYQRQRADLYTAERVALLFLPGSYDIDVPVGYYTTVHGLGTQPEDVSFVGEHGVHQAEPGRNLIQFWRSAEVGRLCVCVGACVARVCMRSVCAVRFHCALSRSISSASVLPDSPYPPPLI